MEADVIGNRKTRFGLAFVCAQASINRAAGATRKKSGWGHMYDLSVDDFRLTVHVIKVFDGGLSLNRHGLPILDVS